MGLTPTLATCDVLGVDVVVGTFESAADAVVARALSGQGGYAVLCNVHVLMTARRNPAVMETVRGAWAVFPDGAPIAWMQRREGEAMAQRVGGPDLMPAVVDRGRRHGLRHGFVGSTPEVVTRLTRNLLAVFPGADVVLQSAPAPGDEEDPSLLERIRSSGCHVVWLALGAPKQECWMRRQATGGTMPLTVGVGAAFDFHAGTKQRAPQWVRRAGLEWAHRVASEPTRLSGRYFRTNTSFIMAATRMTCHATIKRWRTGVG